MSSQRKEGDENTDVSRADNQLPARPSKLSLGKPISDLDLTGLSHEQIQALRMRQAEKAIDVDSRTHEIARDTRALDVKLRTLNELAQHSTASGTSFTASSANDDAIGRTEILIGNTEAAKSGKLTKSQTGEKDRTVLLLCFALVAVLIVAWCAKQ